jgi:transcriptional repressor NF-X1
MEIPCNATAQTSGSNQVLECNDFCAKVLRNRRLAEALDIKREESPDKSLSFDELGYYDDTLCEFYLENPAWCKRMEVTLSEFVQDDSKKTLHFKPMRSQYRRFIHRYAVHFNVSTEAIDPEPQRSIVVRKNIGAYRVPSILLSRAARNPSLNRPPTQLQEGVPKPASKQPVNSLYLSDMAFGLTKLELDAALVPVLKLGEDTINFTSRWVNENDAIVTPLIDDSVSVDEREIIIWQLKKLVKAAFVQNSEDDKASRVDCCWVNQKGEVTWNEKDFSTAINKGDINPTQVDMDKRSANSFATLNTVDDDGWMRVGKINPYKPTVDAWQEMPKNVNSSLVRQAKEEEAKDEEAKDEETKDEEKKVVDDNIEQPVTVETAKPLENNVADKEGEVEESEDWEVDEP